MTVAVVDTVDARERFLALPAEVYRHDRQSIAPTREEAVASLDRPEFQTAQRAWIAVDGSRVRARIVARVSPTLRDSEGLPYGLLGFFEALPGAGEEVRELFAAGIGWLRSRGTGEILGPMDGDTWHRHRLNAGPWDEPPFLLEPYNPSSYPKLWEANGFEVLERYFSTRVDSAAVVAALEPKRQAALAAGYRLRPLDLGRFPDELRRIYAMSRVVFARNFLYTDIPEAEFLALYEGTRALLDRELVWFAQAPTGEDAGFLFAFPDRFRAVAAMRGGRNLLAKLRFLMNRGTDTVNFKTIGVLPGHRRAGLGAALMCQGHRSALEKGYRKANHCLFREGNPSGELDGGSGKLLRTYHLYRWKGGA